MFSSQKAHTLEDFVRQSDLNTRTDVEKVMSNLKENFLFEMFLLFFSKENAQLYFCEAILSAIEQLNINEQCQKDFGQSWSSSIGQFISQCETIRSSSSPSDLLDDSVTDSSMSFCKTLNIFHPRTSIYSHSLSWIDIQIVGNFSITIRHHQISDMSIRNHEWLLFAFSAAPPNSFTLSQTTSK